MTTSVCKLSNIHGWGYPTEQICVYDCSPESQRGSHRCAVSDIDERYAKGRAPEDVRKEYFGAIQREIAEGGAAAALYDLLQMPLGDWHPREIPMTAGLMRQKKESLRGNFQWLEPLLQSGTLPANCGKHGISSATFYKWKAKYGGLDISDAKRLKALRLASRSRMLSSRASTVDSVTSCSTRRCSPRSPMCARPWRSGRMTTTLSDRTVRSATCRQLSLPNSALPKCDGTGRCAMSRAPRPVPLHHRANQAQMKPRLSSSLDETRGSGQTPQQLRAAVEALAFESPKLSAVAHFEGNFAEQLDKAIEARSLKVIEAKPEKMPTIEPLASEVMKKPFSRLRRKV